MGLFIPIDTYQSNSCTPIKVVKLHLIKGDNIDKFSNGNQYKINNISMSCSRPTKYELYVF